MTAQSVNGSGNGARSGAQTLVLLAAPLTIVILRALAEKPMRQTDLRRAAGSPAQTTLRAQLNRLVGLEVIEKHRRNSFPGVLEYELTAVGRELLFVVGILEQWLNRAPDGPLPLEGNASRAATRTLAEGWSTTLVRALAAGPLSLTELDRVINSLSYPALERRLGALRLAGQIEARRGNGRVTPYAATSWLRYGVAPLIAAARWERQQPTNAFAPIRRLDIEATLLLALPLLQLPMDLQGSCRMAAELSNDKAPRLAGVTVAVANGELVSCTTNLASKAHASVHGSAIGWLEAIIEQDTDGLELSGDCSLARALLDGLHRALFAAPVQSR